MRKVIFIFHDSKPRSGATASMLDIIDGLLRFNNVKVMAIIPETKWGLSEELNSRNIEYFECKYYGSRYPSEIKNKNLFRFKAIVKTIITALVSFKLSFKIRNENIDLIYTNTSDTYLGAFINIILRKKHIWHIREFGKEDQNISHSFGDNIFYKLVNITSDKVIVISEALGKKTNINIKSNKIEMIYDDVNYIPSLREKKFNYENTLRLLIVGSLCKGKGQKFIIDCINELKKRGVYYKLTIAGDYTNDYGKWLMSYVEQLKLDDCIEFLGFRTDLNEIRFNYDISIVASSSEAFGRVTIEGMLSELIILASSSGANAELIEDGKTGFIYTADDTESFIEKLTYINNNRDLFPIISRNALSFSKSFTKGDASKKIFELIETTCEQ